MKIVILGSGTCASHLPGISNRYPPGFLVEWEDQKVLFDCSEGIRFRLEQAGYYYPEIQHIAISHSHPDHNALVYYVQSLFVHGLWGGLRNEQLNIYAPSELINNFPRLWNMYLPERQDAYFQFPVLNFQVADQQQFVIGSGKLSAIKVYHGRGLAEAVAFRLETPDGVFVYSGDTGLCEELKTIAQDADVFICDATAKIGDEQTPVEYGHLNPRLVGEISKQAGVKIAVLTHIATDDEAGLIKDCQSSGFAGKVVVAKDFQVITV